MLYCTTIYLSHTSILARPARTHAFCSPVRRGPARWTNIFSRVDLLYINCEQLLLASPARWPVRRCRGKACFAFGKVFGVGFGEHLVVFLLLGRFRLFKAIRAVDLPFVKPTNLNRVLGTQVCATHAHQTFVSEFEFTVLKRYVVSGANFYTLLAMCATVVHLVMFAVETSAPMLATHYPGE